MDRQMSLLGSVLDLGMFVLNLSFLKLTGDSRYSAGASLGQLLSRSLHEVSEGLSLLFQRLLNRSMTALELPSRKDKDRHG